MDPEEFFDVKRFVGKKNRLGKARIQGFILFCMSWSPVNISFHNSLVLSVNKHLVIRFAFEKLVVRAEVVFHLCFHAKRDIG